MGSSAARPTHTWEEAICVLQADPQYAEHIFNSYLTPDLLANAARFRGSEEFGEVLRLIAAHAPGAKRVLDVPGGNGIATYAFAASGFAVTVVEPDPSDMVGRGAIARVLSTNNLSAEIVDARGEQLPMSTDTFDVVYVRQGLHHAGDLKQMVREFSRVLRPGGLLIACREHVVDDYGSSLQAFLDSQVDHQMYGGENAFTLPDYRAAIGGAGLAWVAEFGPYDSPINAYPNTDAVLREKILSSGPGRILSKVVGADLAVAIGEWRLKHRKMPGRLYTFVASKPKSSS
jgi:ubiquinone/menaquinone biosynthesis C-methylase UbiE